MRQPATLMVTDRTPTGNFMLDRTLAKIGTREGTTDTRTWIKVLAAEDARGLEGRARARLGAGLAYLAPYGACDFEVGGKPKVAEPPARVRGELARAMLYMAQRYAVDVRMTQDALRAWHRADPPDRWEVERAGRIEAATGLRNPFIGTP